VFRYMEYHNFKAVEELYGFVMKQPNTIIDKLAVALKLKPGENGALEEFRTMLQSGHLGYERYVE
jgi:hypothetical protein